MNELLEYLNGIEPLTKGAQRALSDICTDLKVGKKEELHPIGHRCRNIYFVRSGALYIYYYKEEKEVVESFEFE